jgi:thioredoxin 1
MKTTGADDLSLLVSKLSQALGERGAYLEKLAKGVVLEVTSANINEVIEKNIVVFLYFTAEWCGPCISFLQTFRDVASIYARPGVYFGKVDVDTSYSIADRYNVKHIPSILIIVRGRVVDIITGSQSREKLEEKVRAYIEAAIKKEEAQASSAGQ